jgi:2-C-methyl-D-erythritol 4-phosphate cytidylyltransferase
MLRAALAGALSAGATVTDESQAMERLGHRPRVVAGDPSNIKITRPEDLMLASLFLQQQAQRA